MTTYLLVHGAFRGGWAWDRVAPLLEERGHRVLAPTLRGCGELADLAVAGLADWTTQLADHLELEGAEDVVAVGHSMGGLAVAALAGASPGRLAVLAFLDAPDPLPGQRGVDLGPGTAPDPLPARSTVLPPTAVRPGGDLDDETAAWVNERLGPTPLAPSLDPVPPATARLRRAHAFCAGTPAGFPCAGTRARLDAEGSAYAVLEAGHDAPLTAPAQVADWLATLAALAAEVPA